MLELTAPTNDMTQSSKPSSTGGANVSTTATSINRIRRILRNLTRIFRSTSTTRHIFSLCSIIFILSALIYFSFTYYLNFTASPQITLPPTYEPSFKNSNSNYNNNNVSKANIILVIPPLSYNSHNSNEQFNEKSLTTLFHSIDDTVYDHYEKPDMQIIITPQKSNDDFERIKSIISKCNIVLKYEIVQGITGSLFERIIYSWIPNKSSTTNQIDINNEYVTIIDASRIQTLSKYWYIYTLSILNQFAHVPNVASVSVSPLNKDILNLNVPYNYNNNVIFYSGFLYSPVIIPLSPEIWLNFQRWFIEQRADWFLWPNIYNLVNRTDPSFQNFDGNVRADWTLWYSRFCSINNLFNIYPINDLSLINYNQAYTKSDFDGVLKFELNGRQLTSSSDDTENSNGVQSDRQDDEISQINENHLEKIVELGKQNNNMVSITLINKSFLETAYSWLCNVDTIDIRPPGIIWITTDDIAYDGLKSINNSYALKLTELQGGSSKTGGTSYGTSGYWLLMLERTKLILSILQKDISVFLFETDQVWLRDPIPFVNRILHNGDEVDMIGTLDTRNEIGGNFLYLKPNLQIKKLWGEVYYRFKAEFKHSGMYKKSRDWIYGKTKKKIARYIENDQSILTKLILYDTKFRLNNHVIFKPLDTQLFVDGRWYSKKRRYYGSLKSRSPIIINNNFLIGIKKKMFRLKKHGHWFYKSGKCDIDQVQRAVLENESRGFKANLDTQPGDSSPHIISVDGQKKQIMNRPRRLEGADVEAGFQAMIDAVDKEIKQKN